MRENTKPGDSVVAQTFRSVSPQEDRTRMCGRFKTWCVRDGETIWVEEGKNVITDVADNHILNVVLETTAKTATWYIGLINASPTPLETHTMGGIGTTNIWDEIHTQYSESPRPTWSPTGPSTASSIANTPAAFNFTGAATVGGCFLTDSSTKGGTTGILFAAIAFSADKAMQSSDILNVTYTFTADDDGVP